MNPFTPSPASDTAEISVHRTPCHYQSTSTEISFLPQWAPASLAQDEIEKATDTKPE
jgi:hypothetical protein